jgi:hypothetical protein
MTHAVLMVLHVGAGAAGLLLGPVAMLAPKRRGRHTRVGIGYQVAIAGVAGSAVGLALLDWRRLWWLALIGVATEAAALGGLWARRRRFRGWLPVHIRLMCGSYISLATALLVVNWGSPVAWVLPTLIGTPLIARAASRGGRRARRRARDASVDFSAL